MASYHIAPDTKEYRAEIAKTRVFHRSLSVRDRVQLRLGGRRAARSTRSFFGKDTKERTSPTPAGGSRKCFVISSDDKILSDSERERKAAGPSNKENSKLFFHI